jgi:hypothetical protein
MQVVKYEDQYLYISVIDIEYYQNLVIISNTNELLKIT